MKDLFKFILLSPLASLWSFLYQLRRLLYQYDFLRVDKFRVPIISIGNLTFGGTGKTPLTIWLIKRLEQKGLTVGVLTRGYKGGLEHSSGCIKGGDKFLSNPEIYGDEPLMIAQSMKRGGVMIGKKRAQNLRKYFSKLKPDAVVLDDGFQHVQLARSFNLVLFDALMDFDQYKVAPLGYLRENMNTLKFADAIAISRSDQCSQEKMISLYQLLGEYHRPDIPIARFGYRGESIKNCFDEDILSVQDLAGKKVYAFTGIASPTSFYNLLEREGAIIKGKKVFSDHYFFTVDDINEILIGSVREDAIVICSEKDMVKVKKISKDLRLLYLKISVEFLSGEEELFSSLEKSLELDNHRIPHTI